MANYFISYSVKDSIIADELRKHICLLDPNNYVFIDHLNIKSGEPFKKKLLNELEKCDYFIILISNNALKSRWVEWELKTAIASEKKSFKRKLFPIRIDDCDIPKAIKHRHVPLFGANFTIDFHRLMNDINNASSFYKAEAEVEFDTEGYLFRMRVEEIEPGYLNLIDHVEYRFDHEFVNSEYNDPIVISTKRNKNFITEKVWTNTPIWVCVVIYFKNTLQECIMYKLNIGP